MQRRTVSAALHLRAVSTLQHFPPPRAFEAGVFTQPFVSRRRTWAISVPRPVPLRSGPGPLTITVRTYAAPAELVGPLPG